MFKWFLRAVTITTIKPENAFIVLHRDYFNEFIEVQLFFFNLI